MQDSPRLNKREGDARMDHCCSVLDHYERPCNGDERKEQNELNGNVVVVRPIRRIHAQGRDDGNSGLTRNSHTLDPVRRKPHVNDVVEGEERWDTALELHKFGGVLLKGNVRRSSDSIDYNSSTKPQMGVNASLWILPILMILVLFPWGKSPTLMLSAWTRLVFPSRKTRLPAAISTIASAVLK
jgi:hypothetical protein